MSDPEKTPMPEQPKTVNLPAMTDRAILEDLSRASREQSATLQRVEGTVAGLVVDGRELHGRMGTLEGRVAKIEAGPTNPPPPPLTSDRVKAIVAVPSQLDLETQAKLAQALSALEDEKAKRIALEEKSATKDDLKQVTESQTAAIVGVVNDAKKSPIVKLAVALAMGALIQYAASKGIHLQ